MESSDPFLIDAVQTLPRRKCGDRAHGGAVGHRGRHRQHHTETMKHGNLNHHSVSSGKVHAVSNGFSIVHHIVMGKHDALGKPGGAAGILHVADIMLVNTAPARLHFALRHRVRQNLCLLPGICLLYTSRCV